MPSVMCTLRLLADKDERDTPRRCELELSGESSIRGGTWELRRNAPDDRLAIRRNSGTWRMQVQQEPLLYHVILDEGHVQLLEVPRYFLERVGCGGPDSASGQGMNDRLQELVYLFWLGCV